MSSRHYRVIVFVVLVVLYPGLAFAEPVTVARVMAMARESAPSVTVAKRRVGVAESGMASAKKLLRFNPVLQGGLVTDAPFDNEGDLLASVGLAQAVEVGGQQGLRRDIASADIASATAEVGRARNDLGADIVAVFFALDGARRQLVIERQIADVYRRLTTLGRSMVERGALTRLDLGILEIETARVEAQVERDVGSAAALESELAGLIGRPGMQLEPVTEDRPALDVPNVDDVIGRAVAVRPELAGARARQQSARSSQTLVGRELWFTPTFGIGVRSERVVHGANGFRIAPGGVPNLLGVDNRFWTASLEVSVPVPIFEQRNTDTDRARAMLDVASAEERAFLVTIETEARATVARAAATARAFAVQEKVRSTTEEIGGLYETSFARGAVTLNETLLGQERVLRARLGYLAARSEYLRARAMVDRAIGLWSEP